RCQALFEAFKERTKSEKNRKGLSPLLDVRTRWGSTFVMIGRAMQCKDAYCGVLFDDGDHECILDTKEWERLRLLSVLLEEFDTLTKSVIASKSYVTISLTIIAYNSLMGQIEQFVNNDSNITVAPDICRGAQTAWLKLRKYYSATDESPIYAV
ncbi:hypothetical protein DFQ27_002555, partial [Actinomortierella ambigua]